MVETIIMIFILASLVLAFQYSYLFFIGTAISLFGLIIHRRYKRKEEIKRIKAHIKSKWGKEHLEKRDFSKIRDLFDLSIKEKEFYIDDTTWSDLNMDTVFSKIDHTKSFPGMQYLYFLLRIPLFDRVKLENRKKTIEYLSRKKDLSMEMQFSLYKLNKEKGSNIINFFKNGINTSTKKLPLFIILSYMPYLALLLLILNRPLGFFLILITVVVNSMLYENNKNKIYEEMETFKYIAAMIDCAKNLCKIIADDIDLKQDRLKELINNTRLIAKYISKINYNDSSFSEAEIILHAYNMILFREPKIFYKTINLLNQYRDDFQEIYKIIGEIDALISIASYMDSLEYYTDPVYIEEKTKFYLKVKELYHPLLDKPVPYTVDLNNKGALVTGSNASGKSTFLRTIGINTIFALTITLALAKEYTTSYFKLLTSIGTTDSIVDGDSYYMAEAKSLKRIIDELDYNQPVLCILDEIFRGTNTAERISAASVSLNYMIERNCCVLAATHDLELTNLVNDKFSNYHFRESITENDISFDYILRDGPCTSRNGIAILKYLGYPDEIYETALSKSQAYLKK